MSEKTVAQKLFIRSGDKFLLVNPPADYIRKLGALPTSAILLKETSQVVDVIQVFVSNRAELENQLPKLAKLLTPKGMLWVTYLKGTAKVKTDINRDTIRVYAHSIGLEGVAIISIDEDWSALRLKLL